MLHKKCSTPVKYRYWCEQDATNIERDDTVKGHEYAKGQYVVLTAEELKALEEEATKAIAIEEFVAIDLIDPVFYDKAYYLAPEKGGERAYRLLTKAMQTKGLVGIAKYAARGKSYLVSVRPLAKGLVMQQLYYANEVRSMDEVPIEEKGEVRDSELQLALQLIEQSISDKFDPSKYSDEVRGRVQEVIDQKIEGQEVTLSPAEAPQAQVIDLMEALKASLAEKPSSSAKASKAASGRKAAKSSPRKAAVGKTPRKRASS
jgi:DNA end-binding protein Ku